MNAVPIITYGACAVFVIAVVVRIIKILRLPIHLRWELYPVAHEKGRASYGGSYLEEPDWWTKPRATSVAGELKVMIPEILLLAGVKEHNKQQWFRSFPFHFGLYLSAALVVLLIVGGLFGEFGTPISATEGGLSTIVYYGTNIVGWAGLILGLLGAVGLLGRRLFNPDYREFTKGVDYFNLIFFIAVFSIAVAAHAVADPDFATLRSYFAGLVTVDFSTLSSLGLSGLTTAEIVSASVLAAYIPLTHMSHFFTKWFMYHDIRWNDAPNLKGSKIERRVQRALEYPVSWAAPHIQGDGKKNWVDVATSAVEGDRTK